MKRRACVPLDALVFGSGIRPSRDDAEKCIVGAKPRCAYMPGEPRRGYSLSPRLPD